jgi:hypothetical protein
MGAGVIQVPVSDTSFSIFNDAADRMFVFEGTDFAFDSDENPTDVIGGTITAIHISADDGVTDPAPLFDITGSLSAASWYDAVVALAAGDNSLIEGLIADGTFAFVGNDGPDSWAATDGNDFFVSSGGDDLFDGQFGRDRAIYTHATGPISVELADGIVTGDASVGTDTLRSIELVTGTAFGDSFDATDFSNNSMNAGSAVGGDVNGTFNEFEGCGGDDIITGNGNTRISYLHATSGVSVNLVTGEAVGDDSVGYDIFTGVNSVRGSYFNDALLGSDNPFNTFENFEGRGGNDFINGLGGFDRANYTFDDVGIAVYLAFGLVFGGANTGIDQLRSIEAIGGTELADNYYADGFTASDAEFASVNSGDALNSIDEITDFNEFEGRGGDDNVIGNGNTRVAFYSAPGNLSEPRMPIWRPLPTSIRLASEPMRWAAASTACAARNSETQSSAMARVTSLKAMAAPTS